VGEHRGECQAKPYETLVMKVRAYLAKGQDHLACKKDSGHYIDLDTSTSDPDEVKQVNDLLFTRSIKYLDHYERSQRLEEFLSDQDILYRKYIWDGPGMYLIWLPATQRIIYRSDILLERELQFMIALDEHLEPNSEGETDRTLIYLS
jgi:hypothetical protein